MAQRILLGLLVAFALTAPDRPPAAAVVGNVTASADEKWPAAAVFADLLAAQLASASLCPLPAEVGGR